MMPRHQIPAFRGNPTGIACGDTPGNRRRPPTRSKSAMNSRDLQARWAPDWALGIAAPMWVSSPDSVMSEINPEAEDLFAAPAKRSLRRPCYEVVAALDSSGQPFCRRECPIRRNLRAGVDLEVHHLRRPRRDRAGEPIHLLPIAVRGPDGRSPWLVHFAIEAGQCQHLHDYLNRVAIRSAPSGSNTSSTTRHLTPRETEILELLIQDRDMEQIARDLHVSYHTVRNHVQHFLPKLSAHSIHQAIAIFLLQEEAQRSKSTS